MVRKYAKSYRRIKIANITEALYGEGVGEAVLSIEIAGMLFNLGLMYPKEFEK
ncbi:MAG: hypothetical protein LBC84_03840 [Prevotellaceae bacterium]|nr:hypothetical protein [Prevotellaceae bacterium]